MRAPPTPRSIVFFAATGVPSDIRLKRDIVLLGHLENGIGIYRYRYLWDATVYVGVMAQEVLAVAPEAVLRAPDGYFRVDYQRLNTRLFTWEEWIAQSSRDLPIAA